MLKLIKKDCNKNSKKKTVSAWTRECPSPGFPGSSSPFLKGFNNQSSHLTCSPSGPCVPQVLCSTTELFPHATRWTLTEHSGLVYRTAPSSPPRSNFRLPMRMASTSAMRAGWPTRQSGETPTPRRKTVRAEGRVK